MTIERKSLAPIIGQTVNDVAVNYAGWLVFTMSNGITFEVQPEDLFDADGMRFSIEELRS